MDATDFSPSALALRAAEEPEHRDGTDFVVWDGERASPLYAS